MNMNKNVTIAIIVALGIATLGLAFWVKTSRDRIAQLENAMGALNVLAMDAGAASPEEVIELYKLAEDSLTQMKMMYDTLRTDNSEMMAQIEEQKSKIDALLKKAKNKDYDIKKLLAETQTLRTLMKGYIHQIDSLQTANDRLYAEGQEARKAQQEAENKSKTLESDLNTTKEIVKAGSVLGTSNFTVVGIRERNSGAEATTDRAAKASMIKTSFTLRENKIVKPGNKTLGVKIFGPGGALVSGKGGAGEYGAVRDINYQNQDVDISIYFSPTSTLQKGTYKIEIYESGNKIGNTEITLK